jgi:protein tyrosine phosphatase (PTP) superfamily phosphohydrolase (DUF442 family)
MNDIYHFWLYDDKLSSSGMPTAEQMQAVAEAGVQVVINLAPHDVPDALPDETALVTGLGMEYVNIPVLWRAPQAEDLVRFMDVMDAQAGRKVHVHCEANYRASAFIMLYRVLRLGWKREDAIPVMERMWNPEDFPIWDAFLREALA